jgi:hypothetical protein
MAIPKMQGQTQTTRLALYWAPYFGNAPHLRLYSTLWLVLCILTQSARSGGGAHDTQCEH